MTVSNRQDVRAGKVVASLPEGWDDRTALTLVGPAIGGVQPNLVVTRETLCNHMGLAAFADGWVARLREQIPFVEERKPVEHVELAGHRAQLREVAWKATDVSVVQLVGLFVADGWAWSAIATAPTGAWPLYADQLRELILGIRIDAEDAEEPTA